MFHVNVIQIQLRPQLWSAVLYKYISHMFGVKLQNEAKAYVLQQKQHDIAQLRQTGGLVQQR